MAKKTKEETIKQFIEKHGDKYDYSKVDYVNHKTKVTIICPMHGEFEQTPNNHANGQGCIICSGTYKLNTEIIISQFIEIHGSKYNYSKVKYINAKTKVCIICPEHGEFWQSPDQHKHGHGCPECSGLGRITFDKIILQTKINNPNLKILDNEHEFTDYILNKERLKYECIICGYIGEKVVSGLMGGVGCPACAGQIVTENNCLYNKRPDLLKYFVNIDDAKTITVSSNKTFQFKCPICGKHKKRPMAVKEINTNFSCDYCSDGISIPEKFVRNIFSQINIDITPQYSPKWARTIGKKYYDIYIENIKVIIEIHGMQHYEETGGKFKNKPLKKQIENDKLKYNLAIQNNISPENYIIIDARYSELEWLKESCIKSLYATFDLSHVDWGVTWENAQKSIVYDVWSAWNNRDVSKEGVFYMRKKFKLGKSTITNYLKRGNNINMCIYDSDEEKDKRVLYLKNAISKEVYQFDKKNNIFIKKFSSISDAGRELNIKNSGISNSCIGKYSQSGGFKWSFNPPNEQNMYPD